MAQRIRYSSLDPFKNEIRVLEVQPADRIEDPAVCRFVHMPLNQDIEFVGLSALLGDQNVTETITIDGSRIAVPENLGEALRYVRAVFPRHSTRNSDSSSERRPVKEARRGPPGWLRRLFQGSRPVVSDHTLGGGQPLRVWSDALCINMGDAREVKAQRTTMASAYRAARMVCGWVGPKDEWSDITIETMRTVDRNMPAEFGTAKHRKMHPEHYAPRLEWMAAIAHLWALEPGIKDIFETKVYKAFSSFLSRTYFQRDWIMKEICMATFPAFLVGDEIVSWLEVIRWNRCNEELIDSGHPLFPDNYRDIAQSFLPLASVYTLLTEYERRNKGGTL